MHQQLGTHTWLATSSNWKKSSVGPRGLCFATTSTLPLLLVSLSASNGHYCPPDVQTPDLHCSTRQYTTRLVSLFVIYRNHYETPDQQTTQHLSHYQHARTHISFHFPSNYYWLEPTVTRTAPETISQLFPSVSALFTNSSIDIFSRDTPAVTGWCPLLDIYWRTEEPKKTRQREVTDAGTTVPLSPHLQCRYSDNNIHCKGIYRGKWMELASNLARGRKISLATYCV